MTDDRFEQRLRGFLAAREPAAVSPVLRARLQSVTAESPVRSGGWIGWLGGAWRGGRRARGRDGRRRSCCSRCSCAWTR